ncbi:SET domain-containing protein SmydA-8 isoform X1 [Anopheles darlingi]|uniref:SET domain-containing protein SmydA-8 isoform X1 n=1 Tax=Anopheles darlingi TaxID=43151 RepID=UPI0021000074|nr:SET domain-containing protein SmydA-8 isoform X1 [Anopheles darlingi]XP_049531238.1 SET domain-containing protein SmydA-8 isoform X1 [Anopheles darlingi]
MMEQTSENGNEMAQVGALLNEGKPITSDQPSTHQLSEATENNSSTSSSSSPERIATFKRLLLTFLAENEQQQQQEDGARVESGEGEPPWDIGVFEGYGRGLVATRDIAVHDLVFVDRPILLGPRVNNYEVIFCASCYRILKRLQLCSGGCRLPICARCDYATSPSSAHRAECELIQGWQPKDAGRYAKHILYALTSIRGFLLSERDRSIVLQMEGHPPRKEMTTEIEQLLKAGYFGNLPADGTDVRYLRQLVDVLNTNAFETSRVVVDEDNNDHEIILRGLYVLGAMMNHCCRPNVRYVFDDQLRMRVYASRPIRAGDQILNNYSNILWGTQHRIIHLCFSKHFLCICERCKDPTEFGTYLGALKCVRERCDEGRLLPVNPLKISSIWRCNRCDLKLDNIKASKIQEIASRMVLNNAIKRDSAHIIAYLSEHLVRFLLPTNQFTVELKLQAIKKIRGEGRHPDELRAKERYCLEILDLLERLRYGECFIKGVLCYELFVTRVTLAALQKQQQQQQMNANGVSVPAWMDEANLEWLRTAWQILRPSGNRPRDLHKLVVTYEIE